MTGTMNPSKTPAMVGRQGRAHDHQDGHGAEPLHVILPGHDMMLASRHSNAVLEIDVDGEGHLAMIKDVQRHPVRPEILHIDLLTVRRGERVEGETAQESAEESSDDE